MPFVVATPESAGISSSAISSMLDGWASRGLEIHGYVLLRHGQEIASGWYRPYAPELRHELFSLSKSFTSTAAGFAITEGLLSLDDHVVSFFPEKVPKDANENMKAMKIRHLLSMNTGHAADFTGEATNGRDWVKAFYAHQPEHAPGTFFVYNNMATYMVSAIVQKLTGMTVRDYLLPRLFQPLGIENPRWNVCPMGRSCGGWGLFLNTREISRFGQFLLDGGKWEGKQLIPQSWIENASSFHSDNKPADVAVSSSDWHQGYGFQFWRCRHGLWRGDGAFGQLCVIMPQYDAVLAVNASVNDMQGEMDAVWEALLPAFQDAALPEDATALNTLRTRSAGLALSLPVSGLEPAQQADRLRSLHGRMLVVEDDVGGLKRIKFQVLPAGSDYAPLLEMIVTDRNGTHSVVYGPGRWECATTTLDGVSTLHINPMPTKLRSHVAGAVVWKDADTLQLDTRFIDTPFEYVLEIRFEGQSAELTGRLNVNMGPVEMPVLTAEWSE